MLDAAPADGEEKEAVAEGETAGRAPGDGDPHPHDSPQIPVLRHEGVVHKPLYEERYGHHVKDNQEEDLLPVLLQKDSGRLPPGVTLFTVLYLLDSSLYLFVSQDEAGTFS